MTLPCGGEEALALFGHEEEAELFLWSLALDGLENGWYVKESRCGEIASVLYGPVANARRVALDPLPMMTEEGTIELVSLDRFDFVAGLLAREEVRTRSGHRKCGSALGRQSTYGRRLCAPGIPSGPGSIPTVSSEPGRSPSRMPREIEGSVVVLTGASSGIGRVEARRLHLSDQKSTGGP